MQQCTLPPSGLSLGKTNFVLFLSHINCSLAPCCKMAPGLALHINVSLLFWCPWRLLLIPQDSVKKKTMPCLWSLFCLFCLCCWHSHSWGLPGILCGHLRSACEMCLLWSYQTCSGFVPLQWLNPHPGSCMCHCDTPVWYWYKTMWIMAE